MKRLWSWQFFAAALLSAMSLASSHAQSITFIGSATSSDYSNTGLNLGTAGYWFANFGASTPVSGAAVDSNAASSLPAWVTVNGAPDTTFSSSATSKGGQAGWANITLPNGTTGLSGAVVDSNTANNSNNTIRALELGVGTPSSFFFHVVTDNTAGENNPTARLRARGERVGVFDISGPNAPTGLAANMNGSPDVYTFRYDGFAAGDIIKLQLNSGNAAMQASIAGFMVDPIPEPASAGLLAMGAIGLFRTVRRRQSR